MYAIDICKLDNGFGCMRSSGTTVTLLDYYGVSKQQEE